VLGEIGDEGLVYDSEHDVRAPDRRSEELVIEALDDELLVYDQRNKRAHCLSATAARVWRACDGGTDLAAMSEALSLPLDEVREAVEELEGAALLVEEGLELVKVGSGGANGNGANGANDITRRAFAVRSAKVGTAVASAPLILSIAAPTTASAATPTPAQCQLYSAQSCGTGSGCAAVAGCCCCGTGGECQGNCNACSATGFCTGGQQQCGDGTGNSTGCSATGPAGGLSVDRRGCCHAGTGAPPLQSGIIAGCGCVYTPTGGGLPNNVAGCCHARVPGNTPCSDTDSFTTNADCFPCCLQTVGGNTVFKAFIGLGSTFGCCGANTTPTHSCIVANPQDLPILPVELS